MEIKYTSALTMLADLSIRFVQAEPLLPEDLYNTLIPINPLINDLQVPGRLEGNGTHFELKNSQYLNITLDISEGR